MPEHTDGDDRIPLRDLAKSSRVWLLSRDGRDAVPGPAISPTYGFGIRQGRGGFNAVFALDDEVWLQVEARRWRASDIRRVELVDEQLRQARYRLTLHDGAQHEVVVRYPLTQLLNRVLDTTYDEIASWSDDIMKLLPYSNGDWPPGAADVAEWAAEIGPRWSKGRPPEE